MRAILHLAITVSVALALLSACTTAQPTPAPVKPSAPGAATPQVSVDRGGSIVKVHAITLTTMDPHMEQATSESGLFIMDNLVRHTFNEQTKRYELVPQLATSWKNIDSKTVAFQLRKGVKFHDGSDFNAEVAKWNLDRMLTHPKSFAKLFVTAIESVDVTGADSIRVNLKAPSASILVNLSAQSLGKTGIISQASATAHDDDWVARNPVGTGPFKFVEWKTDDHITVQRNENYWEMGVDGKPLPYLDRIVSRWIDDETVAATELRAGNVHYVELYTRTFVEPLQKDPRFVISDVRGMNEVMGLAANMIKGRFKESLDLRKAAFYAIDRDAIAKTLGKPGDKAACYLVAEGQLGYDPARVPCYTLDPAKSKQHLAAAGYPNGIDITLITQPKPLEKSYAEMLKSMLDKVNIRTTIDLMERQALIARSLSGENWELRIVGADHNVDPDTTLAFRIVTGAAGNYGGYSDPELDKCVEQGRSSYVDAERHETYIRCLQMIYDKAPFSTLTLTRTPVAITANLRGMRPYWQVIDFWGELWLKK